MYGLYFQDSQLQSEKMTAEIAELTARSKVLADLITRIAKKQGIAADPEGIPRTNIN